MSLMEQLKLGQRVARLARFGGRLPVHVKDLTLRLPMYR
jgi:hypothetical protein